MAAAGTLTAEKFYALWFPAERPALEEALEAIGEFYNMGKRSRGQSPEVAAYDFYADASAIYASFWEKYGIDLHRQELHWWQFRGLLEGLLTHSFRQRVGYRVGDLGELSPKERAEALRYRAMYRLEAPQESLAEHLKTLERLAQKGKEEQAWTEP